MSDVDGEDDATRAFEMLREEVSSLRRGIEMVYRQSQNAKVVDYSLTLGQMTRTLQTVEGRLAAIEGKPMLATQADAYWDQIEDAGRTAGMIASMRVEEAVKAQKTATDELKGMVGRLRDKRQQGAWLAATGFVGVVGGIVLWVVLIAALPWGAGTWLAALPLAQGDRWTAGELLMQAANSAELEKMTRLAEACGDEPVDLCAARTALNAADGVGQEGRPSPVVSQRRSGGS